MTQPKISCLCVTENRSAFLPWLLWNFERQTYDNRELVIVDSSTAPVPIEHPRVRWIQLAPGANIPAKRNVALRAADGEYLAWFDDDDWQHPDRLERLERSLNRGGQAYGGGCLSYFIDLHRSRARFYDGFGHLIFNGGLYRREPVSRISFDEQRHRASDTSWLAELAARWAPWVDGETIFSLWLSHETNISNPRQRRRFGEPLEAIVDRVGVDAWGETSARLEELGERLPPPALEGRSVQSGESDTSARSISVQRRSMTRRDARYTFPPVEGSSEKTVVRPNRPTLVEPRAEEVCLGEANVPVILEPRIDVDLWVLAEPLRPEGMDAWLRGLEQSSGCRVRSWGVGYEVQRALPVRQEASCDWALVSRGWSLVFPRGADWITHASLALKRSRADLVGCFPVAPVGRLGSELAERAALGPAAYWDRSVELFRGARLETPLWLMRGSFLRSWIERSQREGMHLDESWRLLEEQTSRGWLRPRHGWALSAGKILEPQCAEILQDTFRGRRSWLEQATAQLREMSAVGAK